jgi:hypothetical protein
MSVATLFRPGGDPYSGLSDAVALLPARALRVLATDILRHLVALDRAGRLDERVTDWSIAEALGWSERSVQRALHALHRVLGKLGCAIIDRVRQHGRRVISFVRGLASSGTKPAPIVAPSALPLPEKEKREETAATGDRPSSLLILEPQNAEEGEKPDHAELVDRAIALPRDVKPTRSQVEAAIDRFSAAWVEQAIEEGEARPKSDPVRNWALVTIRLERWAESGGPPERPQPKPDPVVAREAQKSQEREEAARIAAEEARANRLWDALSPEQRAQIEAQIDRENPGFRKRWEGSFLAMCRNRAVETWGPKDASPEDPRAP